MFRMLSREVVPDYLYGPGVVMRVLRGRRQAGKKKKKGDVMLEAERERGW